MVGRKAFEPTDEQLKMVESAAAFGMTQEEICCLVFTPTGRNITEKTLRKHFRKQLDGGVAKSHYKLLGTAHSIAGDKQHPGCVAMNIWLQKSQMGKREGMLVEVTGQDGDSLFPKTLRIVHVDPVSTPTED